MARRRGSSTQRRGARISAWVDTRGPCASRRSRAAPPVSCGVVDLRAARPANRRAVRATSSSARGWCRTQAADRTAATGALAAVRHAERLCLRDVELRGEPRDEPDRRAATVTRVQDAPRNRRASAAARTGPMPLTARTCASSAAKTARSEPKWSSRRRPPTVETPGRQPRTSSAIRRKSPVERRVRGRPRGSEGPCPQACAAA
jgi:hypothetical protein